MSGSSVVLDSDFLSAFLKTDRLPLVKGFYQVEHLLVPPAVFREVSQTSLLEAIGLASQHPDSVLLMNDSRARREAIQRGIRVVDIPAFLLTCKLSGFLDRAQIAETVRDLQERDRYGFRADVLARLLG